MGLNKDTGSATFVNIKEGQLYTKKKGGEPEFFKSLTGTIIKVNFKEDEFNGKKFEVAQFTIVDGEETFVLQMRTDSGYFRGFSNSLRSGYPDQVFTVSASSVKGEGDKPKTTCFINQDGLALKWYSTRTDPKDVPELESREWKGNTEWDGSKQIKYWKDWWLSIKFNHQLIASAVSEEQSAGGQAADFYSQKNSTHSANASDLQEPLEDLPF